MKCRPKGRSTSTPARLRGASIGGHTRLLSTGSTRPPLKIGILVIVALTGWVGLSDTLCAQGMAAASKRDLPPVPLPEGVVAPRANFVDIARHAGLTGSADPGSIGKMTYLTETTGTGVALLDFDSDGWLDIFLVGRGRSGSDSEAEPHALFRNLGNLRFESVGEQAGLGSTGWGQGACAGDFDHDGHTDLFVTHWGHDILFRNLAGSGFRDETSDRGLSRSVPRWSTGCSFLDFDRDGDLDLFVAHYVDFDVDTTPLPGEAPQCEWEGAPIPCGPRGLPAESMSLFANVGEGEFQEVTDQTGVRTGKRYHGLGVVAADFDSDGWPDIFVACDSTANLLFRNLQDGTFEEIGLVSGTAYNEDGHEQAGMGVAAADYNGDGLLDLFQTNFAADTNTIYRNEGSGFFKDWTVPSGLATATRYVGWGAEFLDFDRDGWPDLFAANGHVAPSVDEAETNETFAQPRLLFWNRGDGIFHSVSGEAGSGIVQSHASRGSATGDLDNDGDLEIVVVNLGQGPSLLKNQVDPEGNWLSIRVISRTGSDAIGAKVAVTANDRASVSEVRSGGSYLSQGDFRLHFGLGAAQSAKVEVKWPSGAAHSTRQVSANEQVTIRESGPRQP